MNDACIQKEDLAIVLPIIDSINPKVVVEIGTYRGGSAGLWMKRYLPELFITIDVEKLADIDGCHYLHGKSSQDPAVVEQVKQILNGRPVDFLFIDGSHKYANAKRDFELYSPMVRPGGLIMFHDVLYRYADGDVPTLWTEIKQHYNYVEIAQNNDTTGVGIIYKTAPYERTYHGNVI